MRLAEEDHQMMVVESWAKVVIKSGCRILGGWLKVVVEKMVNIN